MFLIWKSVGRRIYRQRQTEKIEMWKQIQNDQYANEKTEGEEKVDKDSRNSKKLI